jgi:hypothetical protein
LKNITCRKKTHRTRHCPEAVKAKYYIHVGRNVLKKMADLVS